MVFNGCQENGSLPVPILELATSSLQLSKENQSQAVILRNIGDDLLYWRVFNKPDWAIIADSRGEIPAEDSASVLIVGDLSVGIDEYGDSVEFRSDGGNAVVRLLLIVDIEVPANGVYTGETEEGLNIRFQIDYNMVRDFQGYFFDQNVVRIEHLPLFGEIQYTDTLFYVESIHDYSLSALYGGEQTIEGKWEFDDGREIGFQVVKQE